MTPVWIEKIKERLQKAQFVDGNPDEPNLDAKFYPETGDHYRSYVVLGDHPCSEDDVNGVIEVHSSPDNNGIAQWITHAYNGDISKLIQAFEHADRVMEQVRQRLMWGNSDEAILNANTMLAQGRSRLHSGEFPVTEVPNHEHSD